MRKNFPGGFTPNPINKWKGKRQARARGYDKAGERWEAEERGEDFREGLQEVDVPNVENQLTPLAVLNAETRLLGQIIDGLSIDKNCLRTSAILALRWFDK